MKRFFSTHLLLIIVFLTGAAVLVIEVAATRILSVYFGNTIFTVSSVLSVILLALSLGYFYGGRLADKKPSELLFYQIIALSGLSVFLLQLLNLSVIPVISSSLSLQYGPIIVSLLLFLLPCFLLGLLSPLVAKLQNIRQQSQGIGRITGDVFFWSTLGSITGSLVTGFFLIPAFGVSEIIIGTGILLLAIGSLGIMTRQKNHVAKVKILLLLIVIPLMQIMLVFLNDGLKKQSYVYIHDGMYDNIEIYDAQFKGRNARFLKQSTDASSAMFLDASDLVYEYSKFFETYKLSKQDIKKALVIGGGAYSVPKALLAADPDVVVDVAEIEPDIYKVAKKYFRVPDNPRLVNHVADGRRFLADSHAQYDVIFGDAFHTNIPAHLTTQEFFRLSKSKLAPDGVFIMNAIGRLRNEQPSFLWSEYKTFNSVYPNNKVFAVYSPDFDLAQNFILIGFNTDKRIDAGRFQSKVVDTWLYDLAPHAIFTDNYSPAEYFIAMNGLQ